VQQINGERVDGKPQLEGLSVIHHGEEENLTMQEMKIVLFKMNASSGMMIDAQNHSISSANGKK